MRGAQVRTVELYVERLDLDKRVDAPASGSPPATPSQSGRRRATIEHVTDAQPPEIAVTEYASSHDVPCPSRRDLPAGPAGEPPPAKAPLAGVDVRLGGGQVVVG